MSKRADTTILTLLHARDPGKTICPSEVARAMDPDHWRPLMQRVRDAAAKLADRGEIIVTQKGKTVDVRTVRGPVRIARPAKSPSDYAAAYRDIDFRAHPELYRVGKGEQGVLIAEPYKGELLPLWRFKTPAIAKASSAALWKAFVAYRKQRDFVGMDMARKFLQMGFTRARRYANHKSGVKYAARRVVKPIAEDAVKAASATIFYEVWQRAERDRTYAALKREATGARPRPTRRRAA